MSCRPRRDQAHGEFIECTRPRQQVIQKAIRERIWRCICRGQAVDFARVSKALQRAVLDAIAWACLEVGEGTRGRHLGAGDLVAADEVAIDGRATAFVDGAWGRGRGDSGGRRYGYRDGCSGGADTEGWRECDG